MPAPLKRLDRIEPRCYERLMATDEGAFAHTITLPRSRRPRPLSLPELEVFCRDPKRLKERSTLDPGTIMMIKKGRTQPRQIGLTVECVLLLLMGRHPRLRKVPPEVIDWAGAQVAVSPQAYTLLGESESVQRECRQEARALMAFRACGRRERKALKTHLTEEAMRQGRTATLTELAVDWLYQKRIIAPGETVLNKIVGWARRRADEKMVAHFDQSLDDAHKQRMDGILIIPPGERLSSFELLKKPPAKPSSKAMKTLCDKLDRLESLGARMIDVGKMGPSRIRHVAREVHDKSVYEILSQTTPRLRYAQMACFLRHAFVENRDRGIDMYLRLIQKYTNKARALAEDNFWALELLREKSFQRVLNFTSVFVEPAIPYERKPEEAYTRVPEVVLAEDVRRLNEESGEPDKSAMAYLDREFTHIRQFAPPFLKMFHDFEFPPERRAMADAMQFLRRVHVKRTDRKLWKEAPLDWIPDALKKHIIRKDGSLSRHHYEACFYVVLSDHIKGLKVWLPHSRRYADLETYLHSVEKWTKVRKLFYDLLLLPLSDEEFVERFRTELEDGIEKTQAYLDAKGEDASLYFDEEGVPHLEKLEAIEKPEGIEAMKDRIFEDEIGQVDLPDVVIDVFNDLGLLDDFKGPDGEIPRTPDHARNVVVSFTAYACNHGPKAMARSVGSISPWQIADTFRRYLTEENLKTAIMKIVNRINGHPLVKIWGSGAVAHADGLRFVQPLGVLQSEFHYRLKEYGVVYLPSETDTHAVFYSQVIPCHIREALFLIDGLLMHDSELEVRMQISDMHGKTNPTMALAHLLGYRLCPRPAGIPRMALSRFESKKRYGSLAAMLKHKIDPDVIKSVYDQIVRLAASAKSRLVAPSLLLYRLSSFAADHPLHQGLDAIGRALFSSHVLRVIRDAEFRRMIHLEVDKGESSHRLDREGLFIGKFGESWLRDLTDQANSFSCLSLMHNIVVYWNLMKMEEAIKGMRARGEDVPDEILRHIYPTHFEHINRIGRYVFNIDRLTMP